MTRHRRRITVAAVISCVFIQAIPLVQSGHTKSKSPRYFYVAKRAKNAKDSNPGTKKRPLKTIGEAASRARRLTSRGRPAVIRVRPGTYRETVQLAGSKGKEASLRIEGTGKRDVIISGSDVMTGWNRPSLSPPDVYARSWTHNWGFTPLPSAWQGQVTVPAIVRRREMVFVDGRLLTQVLSRDAMHNRTRSFYVDETANQIYIHLPTGAKPSSFQIEVAVRPYLLQASRRNSFKIRKLIFRHAATPLPHSAVSISRGSRVKIVRSKFIWNNWGGLGLSRMNKVLVRGSVGNRNGVTGMGGVYVRNMLFLDSATSFNNWRGSMDAPSDNSRPVDRNFIDWATGQKFLHARDITFRRHRSIANLTGGLWFDHDNKRILLDGVRLERNATHGVFIEATQGPFKMKKSLVCGNETGVLISKSTRGRLLRNVIKNNRISQIFVSGAAGEPRTVHDYQSGKTHHLQAENWTIRRNRLKSHATQRGIDTLVNLANWKKFARSLDSDENRWNHSGTPDLFRVVVERDGKFEILDLPKWRRRTGEDRRSSTGTAGVACTRTAVPSV